MVPLESKIDTGRYVDVGLSSDASLILIFLTNIVTRVDVKIINGTPSHAQTRIPPPIQTDESTMVSRNDVLGFAKREIMAIGSHTVSSVKYSPYMMNSGNSAHCTGVMSTFMPTATVCMGAEKCTGRSQHISNTAKVVAPGMGNIPPHKPTLTQFPTSPASMVVMGLKILLTTQALRRSKRL